MSLHEKGLFYSWIQLGLLALLFLGIGVVAFDSGFTPDKMGHTSDEVAFTFLHKTRDCTSNATAEKTCFISCDSGYKVVTGACISESSPPNWRHVGYFGSFFGQDTWLCRDEAHTIGTNFRGEAWCLKAS